jgi:hypothetical protein
MPLSVNNPSAYAPQDRVGECAWHTSGERVFQPVSSHKTIKKVTVSVASKSKKGGK